MSRFLTVVSVEEAIATVRRISPPPGVVSVPLANSLRRVLAKEVTADIDIPGFPRSTVDGYAVNAADTTGASESQPAMLTFRGTVAMGVQPPSGISADECAYIPTGGILPTGADAVVMVEFSERLDTLVLLQRPVATGENVIRKGEDFTKGAPVLLKGHLLRPQDMGVLAAVGVTTVQVYSLPRIGIISTGNELVPVDVIPGPGQVRDVNSSMVGGFIAEYGAVPQHYGILPDDPHQMREILAQATKECDAVILSGGSSKDVRDICTMVVSEMGEVLVHGIALQPGKPTIIGRVGKVPVIGLPGHPASACIVFWVIVKPFLEAMTGGSFPHRVVRATLTQNIPSSKGREDYIRVQLRGGNVTPLFGKSGLVNTLIYSDGMVRVPAASEGFEQGEEVEVILW